MPGNEIGATLVPSDDTLDVLVECDAAVLVEERRETQQNVWRKLRDFLTGPRVAEHGDDLIRIAQYAIRNVERDRLRR